MTGDALDDLSASPGGRIVQIVGPNNETVGAFANRLVPEHGRVRFHLFAGWLALGLSIVPAILGDWHENWGLAICGMLLSAALIGYWVAYIALFLHEGAHFGLAKSRRVNDLVTNIGVGLLIGQDVRRYRAVHWQHHLQLGTTADTEISYFNPLTLGFVFRTLSGIQVLVVLATRRRVGKRAGSAARSFPTVAFGSIALHLGILTALVATGEVLAAMAWIIGLGAIFPAFGALRQLLEHRSDKSDPAIDYRQTPHGAFTRLFDAGPIGSTLGGAGFRRHLLHHWLPQVSSSNYDALEAFLLQTELGTIMAARRTTYFAAARTLWTAARGQK